jgi:hypothetical protein
VKDLSKNYGIVSVPYSVPDNDKLHFQNVDFRFGWNNKEPYKIAIQFVNHGYSTRKLKFAIKDVTSKKMIILDPIHNSRFGTETLKANSVGIVWAGPIDNNQDSFSLRVWDSDGEEFDKVAISIKDQE